MENKDINYREYSADKNEMTRRKFAFAKLIISFNFTVFILSFNSIISMLNISIPLIAIASTTTIILIFIVNRMLTKQSNWTFRFSEVEIERRFGNVIEKYLLREIKSIRIKRNCKGYIREIRYITSEAKPFFINGLIDFEKFNDDLLVCIKNENSDVQIINYKEPPVDYDHPVFYVILGLILGTITTFSFKIMVSIYETSFKYIQLGIACFVIVFGIFCCLYQPVRSRYGNKSRKIDFIFGLLSLGSGLFIILMCLNL